MLVVDFQARTISGRAIPWNTVSIINRRRIALHPHCLTWPDPVKLLLRHNHSLIVGEVSRWEPAVDGLYVTCRVQRGPQGDRALAAADELGWEFSCGFELIDYTESDAVWCVRGQVIEISLVPNPAFPQERYVTEQPVEGLPEGELIESDEDELEPTEYVESDEEEPEGEPVEERPPPPEYISEANRLRIEEVGEAIETFTGRILTREDLEAYNQAQQEKL